MQVRKGRSAQIPVTDFELGFENAQNFSKGALRATCASRSVSLWNARFSWSGPGTFASPTYEKVQIMFDADIEERGNGLSVYGHLGFVTLVSREFRNPYMVISVWGA